MNDPIADFRREIEAHGLRPGEIIADGQIHRCPLESKPNGKGGSYILHADEPAAGYWKNWMTGETGTWSAKAPTAMSTEERERFRQRIEADKKARQAEEVQRHAEAREKSAAILADCGPAPETHPYLVAKGVPAHPLLKLGRDGVLLVPVLGADGQAMSLQRIWPDGSKKFLAGGKTAGGFFPINPEGSNGVGRMYVTEGLATGLTVAEATGSTTICAFNCGNLLAVARLARKKYPNREIVIAGDDDWAKPSNRGAEDATKAAQAINGMVVLPRFTDASQRGTDFNDLALVEGIEAVKVQLARPVVAQDDGPPMDECPPWDDAPPPDDQDAPAAAVPAIAAPVPSSGTFIADLDLAEYMAGRLIRNQPPTLNWTFMDSLLTKTVGFLCGAPGVGKSTLLLHLAAMVSTGQALFGDAIRPGTKGKVLALFCEEDDRVLWHRVHRIGGALGPDGLGSDFDTDAFLVPAAGKDMRLVELGPNGNPQASQVFRDLLVKAKSMEGLALIILDPLSRLYGLNENDNAAATLFCTLLGQLAEETGASVLCCHHTSKGANLGADKKFDLGKALGQDSMRGASALTGAARWQMNLVTLPENKAREMVGDPDAKPGQYLAAQVSKKNYGPPEAAFFLRRLEDGLLEVVEIEKSENEIRAEYAIEEWILKTVAAHVADGKLVTVDGLTRMWKEWKPLGFSKVKVKDVALAAIEDGGLVIDPQKNIKGKMVDYLRPGRGEMIPPTPPGIPPRNTPPIPPDTAQNVQAVLMPCDNGISYTAQDYTAPERGVARKPTARLSPLTAHTAPSKEGELATINGHTPPSAFGSAGPSTMGENPSEEKSDEAIHPGDEVTI